MKTKIGIVILAVVCIGLGIGLLAIKKQADDQRKNDADKILDLSNQVVNVNEENNDLHQVNITLTNDLADSRADVQTFSNNLTEVSGTLTQTKASLQNAQDQIANLNGRISDLESENKVLDDRASSLSNTIESLDSQIADTEQKLSSSQTNNSFLAAELQKQMAQKAELQRQFNDLDDVRAQVKKLRDELFVERRLQWINAGYSAAQLKGAELLMQPRPVAPAIASRPAHYDLNVEVSSDGSVHVISLPTNAPAVTNPPPQ